MVTTLGVWGPAATVLSSRVAKAHALKAGIAYQEAAQEVWVHLNAAVTRAVARQLERAHLPEDLFSPSAFDMGDSTPIGPESSVGAKTMAADLEVSEMTRTTISEEPSDEVAMAEATREGVDPEPDFDIDPHLSDSGQHGPCAPPGRELAWEDTNLGIRVWARLAAPASAP